MSYPDLALGEGFDSFADTPQATGNFCYENAPTVTNIFEQRLQAFIATSETEFEHKLALGVKGTIPVAEILVDLGSTLTQHFTTNGANRVLTALVRMKTVRRNANLGSPEYDFCNTSGPYYPANLTEFFERCGDSYLDNEVMGGYVVLTLDVSSFTEEQITEIAVKLGLPDVFALTGEGNDEDGSIEAEGGLDEASSSTIVNFAFVIDAIGVPPPNSGELNGSGEMEAGGWTNYADRLASDVADAITNEEFNAAAYGVVMEQAIKPYNHGTIDGCVAWDIVDSESMACLRATQRNWEYFNNTNHRIRVLLAEAETRLANPTKYRWDQPAADSQNALEAWVDAVNECLTTTLPSLRSDCRDDIGLSDDTTDFCTNICVIPEDCNVDALVNRFLSLPQSQWFENNVAPEIASESIGHDDSRNLPNGPSTHLCTLAHLQGRLDASTHDVSLAITGSPAVWNLSTTSSLSNSDELLSATANCIDVGEFYNDDTNNAFDMSDGTAATVTSVTESDAQISSSQRFGAAVRRVGGKLRGNGERVRILGNGTTWDRRVENDHLISPSVTGAGFRFGFQAPMNSTTFRRPENMQDIEADAQTVNKRVALAATQEGYCYLTDVGGDFWTPNERVRLSAGREQWELAVSSGCTFPGCRITGHRQMRASATCYSYNQNGM